MNKRTFQLYIVPLGLQNSGANNAENSVPMWLPHR